MSFCFVNGIRKLIIMNKKLLFSGLAAAMMLTQAGNAQMLVGVTNSNQMFMMANVSAPSTTTSLVNITGMAANQNMVGIDYRPATGELYGLGYNPLTGDAQLYTISNSGLATAVGTAAVLNLGTSMSGSIGFDFNPTVDRIRVVGENGKNYRLHPTTGAIVATDGDLQFAVADPNFGGTPSIGAIGYTNSYIGATTTLLVGYDETLNAITTQNPPNAGTLNTVGSSMISINPLNSSVGMDIYKDPVTLVNTAYLSANTGISNSDNLYTVNLTTGATTLLGTIGSGIDVRDIAIVINRTQTPVSGKLIYAMQAGTSNMISFDSDNPRFIRDMKAITGITAGQTIVGLDFRPATFGLYAMGYNSTSMEYQLYTIDAMTGAATAVNMTPGMINLGAGGHIGVDFNPQADRLRVTSTANNTSYRINPIDGTISATDMSFAYVTTDMNAMFKANIGSVAYTNSYKGATSTAMYGIDDSLGVFVKVDPPNDGKINTILSLPISLNLMERTSDIDFFYDSTTSADIGFVALSGVGELNDKLYTMNVAGSGTVVSDIGLGINVSDIAAQPQFRNAVSVKNIAMVAARYNLYPNPSTGNLYLDIPAAKGSITATITDLSGRALFTTVTAGRKLDIAGLPAGIYILKVQAETEVFEAKSFVKQ
jgi:hypothetical protein